MSMTEAKEITGVIVGITFRNEENGYTVFRCETKADPKPITVVGCTLAREGETVALNGAWRNDPKFGLQFAATSIIAVRPDSPKGIESYLASGVIRGIGPVMAKRIVAMYGVDTLNVMDRDPAAIGRVPGVGAKRVEQIRAAWKEQSESRRIMVFLANQNISGSLALRIFRQYGEDSIAVIQTNPYRLAREVRGIGFTTADQIARDLGIPETSTQRIEAGLRHSLSEATARGHCGLTRDGLLRAAAELLNLGAGWVETVLDGLMEQDQPGIVRRNIPDAGECYFTEALNEAERRSAINLKSMIGKSPPWRVRREDLKGIAERAQAEAGVVLAEEQMQAVMMALTQRVSILTGGPGTGKTSTLNVILKALRSIKASVVMGAPTGKAAKRMRETTGSEASTVARLVGLGMGQEAERKSIDGDILILDESSMVDSMMLDKVLRAMSAGAAVLFVGDVDQLPSVGSGRVLADMIESGLIPTTRLTKVFRQAQQSAIIRNAHRINKGLPLEDNAAPGLPSDFYWIDCHRDQVASRIIEMVTQRIPAKLGCTASDIQVLSPMRKSNTGTDALNIGLQSALNPKPAAKIPRPAGHIGVGDRVIQTVNCYEKGVMNGESGVVLDIDAEDEVMTVLVDDKKVVYPIRDADQLTLAYAMTVHKSQGSQFPAVVIPVTTSHYMMLNRPVIYTAVTRAAKFCVLIGERRAMEMALKSERMEPRLTQLMHRLRAA